MDILILVGLFVCHTLADYTHLSTAFMLNAKKLGKPLYPIFLHAGVHAIIMFLFLNLFFGITGTLLICLFALQLITHFVIDVWKGRMNAYFPKLQNPANNWHWIIFGTDQLLHSLVLILMYMLVINFK